MTAQDILDRWESAAPEATQGTWSAASEEVEGYEKTLDDLEVQIVSDDDATVVARDVKPHDALLILACQPAHIAAVLSYVRELEQELATMRRH